MLVNKIEAWSKEQAEFQLLKLKNEEKTISKFDLRLATWDPEIGRGFFSTKEISHNLEWDLEDS